eukprot:9918747-Prorocentrum_lima.AAC.1
MFNVRFWFVVQQAPLHLRRRALQLYFLLLCAVVHAHRLSAGDAVSLMRATYSLHGFNGETRKHWRSDSRLNTAEIASAILRSWCEEKQQAPADGRWPS